MMSQRARPVQTRTQVGGVREKRVWMRSAQEETMWSSMNLPTS